MTKRNSRKISLFLFLLTALVLLSIAACNSNTAQLNQSLTAVRSPVATKIISDAFGQVEIPLYPQRVVVLDDHLYLDSVLALGIKPVGVVSCHVCIETFRGIPNDLVTGIPDVGIAMQPSLERILSLKPDIILAHDQQKKMYPQLSAIAPTVGTKYESVMDFKEKLRYFAQILGKSDRAEELLAQYEERIQQLRQQLRAKLGTKTVSIIRPFGAKFSVDKPEIPAHGQIISDAGFKFTQTQKDQKESSLSLSIEALRKYDADYLFLLIVLPENHEKIKSSSFFKQPIWSTLKAVQNQRVYPVNWDVGGLIGANRVIDDIYKLILNTP